MSTKSGERQEFGKNRYHDAQLQAFEDSDLRGLARVLTGHTLDTRKRSPYPLEFAPFAMERELKDGTRLRLYAANADAAYAINLTELDEYMEKAPDLRRLIDGYGPGSRFELPIPLSTEKLLRVVTQVQAPPEQEVEQDTSRTRADELKRRRR